MSDCTHKVAADHMTHVVAANGRRVWRCSHCQMTDTWGKSWSYFGNIECIKCQRVRVDAVACSERCRKALDAVTR